MIITNFVLYDKGSTPITGGVKKAIMDLSNKWDSLLNSDEDLDYEYSDNDDSDRKKFEKPEIEDSKIKCASTDIQSQVDSTFDISITVNNEFFTSPTSTLPSSADQTPFLFS
ncbi:hypothetical protein MTP99_018955 [Tenebrio molitor]|nr:hypothetical protein MTP99_018955 [Tenebrio molitor]